ncbi:MAG: SHOCT domain-containing protein [Cytophagaceae bacterium]|nr:SHOCT domain-containing protein [Cytophagaceae bacterium]
MLYDGYHLWGMHLVWWFAWFIMIFWIFATPYTIPGQRSPRNSALDILMKRFAAGEISKDEYQERKNILQAS